MRARALLALLLVAAVRAAGAADPEPASVPAPPEAPAAAEPAADACAAAPAPDAGEIARRAEAALRGDGSEVDATLSIARDGRSPRTLPFRVWDDALGDRVLVRVLPPASAAGAVWLKIPPVLWSFDPKADATQRIPRAHWADPWMEGEFSLDDVVRGSGPRDYEQKLVRVDAPVDGGPRAWVIESTPRDPAAVAWARLVDWIECEHATLQRREFHDAKGALVRTLSLEDLRDVAGRRYPHLWVMRAAADPARESRIRVDAVRFDPEFAAGTFSTQSLHRGD